MHNPTDFILRGGDAAFANRQRLLFDQLSIAESKCNKHDKSETSNVGMECEKRPAEASEDHKQKRETKRFRGKESIFKRPEGPAPRANFRSIPDHHRNPHKWTKYTLDDVSSEDMTERSNMQAAMSFLKDLKSRKRKENVDECDEEMDIEPCESNTQSNSRRFKSRKSASSSSRITFRKPQTAKETANDGAVINETDDKPVFRSSKIILPEYVIGQKPKKTCKQNRPMVKVDRSKELRLDHLQEPDEEEDD
ncbi:protein TSSC4 isoform X2 [Monomorium pharaonis]|nr:protein TSSC4 isoform X2 [Monomorium pharaonis]